MSHPPPARPSASGDGEQEAGSAAVELTLLSPLLVLLLLLVVAGGRHVQTRAQVDAAAQAAARAATTARDPAQATAAAEHAATVGLATGRASCRQVTVAVDTRDFVPGGTASVTVTCTLDLADLAGLGLPGSREVSSTATARIDVHRGLALPPPTGTAVGPGRPAGSPA